MLPFFGRDRTKEKRMIKVVFKDGNDPEEKVYHVRQAKIKNGWLKIKQITPERVQKMTQEGERSQEIEIRSRELWLNKDFIVAIQDPYHPGRSDLNIGEDTVSLDLEQECDCGYRNLPGRTICSGCGDEL